MTSFVFAKAKGVLRGKCIDNGNVATAKQKQRQFSHSMGKSSPRMDMEKARGPEKEEQQGQMVSMFLCRTNGYCAPFLHLLIGE